jgi:Tat-targeted selenate reductase subunit YnfE
MNCYGGFLSHYGTYSTAQIACAMPYTYGSNDGNSTWILKTPNWW